MVVWSALILYLVCDFFIFTGPLRRELNRMNPSREDEMAEAIREGICAKVYNRPIYLSQVDRRLRENLWRAGREPDKISPVEMRGLRWVACNELIDELLMQVRTRANERDVPVSKDEVDEEVARFERRFASSEELEKAMQAQGIESRKELRYRLAARLQQDKYVQQQIQPGITVSDEEARRWYDEHKKEITMPERRRVRHVFLATLGHPPEEVKQELEGHLELIKAGKEKFADLAKMISEDARTKHAGGDLGWVRKSRLPDDFAAAVFALPAHSPTLVRTKLGWHILEVTEIKPPELLPYAEMKEEITAALSDMRREDAVKQYRHQLRVMGQENVKIYNQLLK